MAGEGVGEAVGAMPSTVAGRDGGARARRTVSGDVRGPDVGRGGRRVERPRGNERNSCRSWSLGFSTLDDVGPAKRSGEGGSNVGCLGESTHMRRGVTRSLA